MLEEIRNFLEANKGNETEFNKIVETLQPYVPMKEADLTVDKVQSFLNENQEGRSFFDSEKDKHYSKALDTWKQNNLNKMIDDEIKKRNPSKDPKDLEIEELKKRFEESERKQFEKDMLLSLKDKAIEKQVPSSLVHLLIGQDEETTLKNFEAFEQSWKQEQEKAIQNVYQKEGYTPTQGAQTQTFTYEQISKMTESEINANWEAIQRSMTKK